MKIQIVIAGEYSDGQKFGYSTDNIADAISELEMIESNEHAFDDEEETTLNDNK